MHRWTVTTTTHEKTFEVEADRVDLNPTKEGQVVVVAPFVVFWDADDQPVAAFPTHQVIGIQRDLASD